MSPGNDAASEQSELSKEFQYLSEEQKIIRIMDMLKNVYFGTLTIKKHKGKIAAFDYQGEVLFKLEDYEKGSRKR
jgi:hypothetical protein